MKFHLIVSSPFFLFFFSFWSDVLLCGGKKGSWETKWGSDKDKRRKGKVTFRLAADWSICVNVRQNATYWCALTSRLCVKWWRACSLNNATDTTRIVRPWKNDMSVDKLEPFYGVLSDRANRQARTLAKTHTQWHTVSWNCQALGTPSSCRIKVSTKGLVSSYFSFLTYSWHNSENLSATTKKNSFSFKHEQVQIQWTKPPPRLLLWATCVCCLFLSGPCNFFSLLSFFQTSFPPVSRTCGLQKIRSLSCWKKSSSWLLKYQTISCQMFK